jgi:hypothetical protein
MATAGAKKKITQEQVTRLLDKHHGFKTLAAEELGIAYNTLERYYKENPDAQEVVAKWKKMRVERAHRQLDDCIMNNEPWAISLVLKADRTLPYGDRIEINDRRKIVVKLVKDKE